MYDLGIFVLLEGFLNKKLNANVGKKQTNKTINNRITNKIICHFFIGSPYKLEYNKCTTINIENKVFFYFNFLF